MNIMWKVSLACGILGIALGAFLTKRFFPTQVETTKNNIITKTVTVTKPSGEKTTTIVVNDQSTKKEVISPILPVDKKLDYGIGVTYSLNQQVGIVAQRRMLADLWLVGTINQTGSASLGFLYAF